MNVVLIGMPGCGKSTVGVILAKALAYDFIDSDLLIQRKAGMPLQQIIDTQGTEAFKALENEVNASIECDETVIATGGSAVYCDDAMEHLSQIGRIVYIRVSYDEIERRISDFSTRGLVRAAGESLREMYDERMALYEKYAHATVEWEGQSAEEIVALILKNL